ncbi:MAG: DUF1345 domain-containing protein [Amaricoccus sp.]|uniref:DUF1345 domain-containing protein n=1 Tax=Amaricoccus sp. TaxID=1872485 RepID=UPI0039E60BF6
MNIRRHGRFYLALALGAAAFLLAAGVARWEARFLVAGNVFFLCYIVLSFAFVVRASDAHLKRSAASADEGLPIILAVAGAAVLASLGAVAFLLNATDAARGETALAIAAIPLGWMTVHTIVAFHYANMYYAPRGAGYARGLEFPGSEADGPDQADGGFEPGPWDFLYFSFVIGMTAQVSDVAVSSARIRRSVLAHGVLSFFYYTGIVALAVNAAGG